MRHLPWLNRLYYGQTEKGGKRGFSFSRWGGFGDHKHPIFFSGDTKSTWECLAFEERSRRVHRTRVYFIGDTIQAAFSGNRIPKCTSVGHSFLHFPLAFAHIPREKRFLIDVRGSGGKRKAQRCGRAIICARASFLIYILLHTARTRRGYP